jgi:CRISPR-associated protein Csb2
MRRVLLISVRFDDGRYHGAGKWPPSPARLFQAFVAGAARGEKLAEKDKCALAWLEAIDPPVIAAPPMRVGRGFRNFVPNNDLDSVGGDLKRMGKIRAPKQIRPILFDADIPLLYLWSFDDNPGAQANARRVCVIAKRLYELGRGVDMAWAWGEIVAPVDAETRLVAHGGVVHRPGRARADITLAVPTTGSLDSLIERHTEARRRFRTLYESKPTRNVAERRVAVGQIFSQPRKPRFTQVPYNSPPVRLVFDIRSTSVQNAEPEFSPWPLTRAVELVTAVRDSAASRLKKHFPEKEALIERVLIGRDATEADKAARVRIAPLPSIGHTHADHAIRRVLVEVPPNCPLAAADIRWGFSVELAADDRTGEFISELVPAGDDSMLDHYGIDHPARVWRTVTPAALPQSTARGRIAPRGPRDPAERKGAAERAKEQDSAAVAVVQALRHVGVGASGTAIRVQREPFAGYGGHAEGFAPGTRFAKQRLWHVEISFAQPVRGPLIFGDGRYLGLGLMQPVDAWHDVLVFGLAPDPRVAAADRGALLDAVRRALMSLARRGDGSVPRLFSGHEPDGAAAQSGRHEHVFLSAADLDADGYIDALIVSAPWRCDHSVRPNRDEASLFDRVVTSLELVRAGKLGIVSLLSPAAAEDARLVGPARVWESHAWYSPTRPVRRGDNPVDVLRRDAAAECQRRGLPMPILESLDHSSDGCGHITGRLRMSFAVGVFGPIMLGRDSHAGGGLFLAIP